MPDWFDRIPKVELHCHLEGAIPLDALWRLVQRHGGDPQVPDLQHLRQRFRFRDFHGFISAWVWKNRWLRTADDLADAAEAVARHLVAQRILHAELSCSPADFAVHGLDVPTCIAAVRRGLDRVDGLSAPLVCDLVRDFGPDQARRTLDALDDCRGLGVVAVGLGGSEREHPAEWFTDVFHLAAERGWRRTVHAGEAAGAGSVRAAVELLNAQRIGHGIRAIEDPAVVALLAERRIPLEICPGSNLATHVVASIDRHPVTRLRDAGCIVTINTDDPGMFGNSLAGEFRMLCAMHGWTRPQVRAAVLAAADAAFLPDDRKRDLHDRIAQDPTWDDVGS